MKLVSKFSDFLKTKVNLSEGRIESLDDRVAAIDKFLAKSDHAIAERFVQTIPQGSYAQGTIINPVAENDEFDADVLVEIEEDPEWEPSDYVQKLYESFRSNGTYKSMVRRRSRCVTVDYANEFHLDAVPLVRRHGQQFLENERES
jgi:predicted RecB family nuclease